MYVIHYILHGPTRGEQIGDCAGWWILRALLLRACHAGAHGEGREGVGPRELQAQGSKKTWFVDISGPESGCAYLIYLLLSVCLLMYPSVYLYLAIDLSIYPSLYSIFPRFHASVRASVDSLSLSLPPSLPPSFPPSTPFLSLSLSLSFSLPLRTHEHIIHRWMNMYIPLDKWIFRCVYKYMYIQSIHIYI